MNYNTYCINCGRKGHAMRKCLEPVTSLGIITYKVIKDEIKIIMIQRRNSMCYVEFLRGRYNHNNLDYILLLLDGMTNKEILDIKTKTFEELWQELWVNTSNKQYKNDFSNSKYKYSLLNLEEIIKKKSEFYEYPEWGFPKGRRNFKETDVQCAVREFCEETGLDADNINIFKNIIPVREDFLGNNNVRYRHIYYLAKIRESNKDIELYIDPDNSSQVAEIGDIQWLSKDECLEKIRESDGQRKIIINNLFSFITKLNSDFYLKQFN